MKRKAEATLSDKKRSTEPSVKKSYSLRVRAKKAKKTYSLHELKNAWVDKDSSAQQEVLDDPQPRPVTRPIREMLNSPSVSKPEPTPLPASNVLPKRQDLKRRARNSSSGEKCSTESFIDNTSSVCMTGKMFRQIGAASDSSIKQEVDSTQPKLAMSPLEKERLSSLFESEPEPIPLRASAVQAREVTSNGEKCNAQPSNETTPSRRAASIARWKGEGRFTCDGADCGYRVVQVVMEICF